MRPQYLLLEAVMDALAERLDVKLREWKPDTAAQVRQQVTEIIELADQDVLDVLRSRLVEQEVLDMLDEPTTR
jgi:hypothetical protein